MLLYPCPSCPRFGFYAELPIICGTAHPVVQCSQCLQMKSWPSKKFKIATSDNLLRQIFAIQSQDGNTRKCCAYFLKTKCTENKLLKRNVFIYIWQYSNFNVCIFSLLYGRLHFQNQHTISNLLNRIISNFRPNQIMNLEEWFVYILGPFPAMVDSFGNREFLPQG